MSQLLIIDVQNRFSKDRNHLENLALDIVKKSADFGSIIFIIDTNDGDAEDFPESFFVIDELDEDNYQFYPFHHNIIKKNYGFIRNFMDNGLSDEEIIEFGKWMISKNLSDARDIEENNLTQEYKNKFQNSEIINYDFDSNIFYLPDDLIEEINNYVQNGCVLVGGGVNECLKEISLLLSILNIEHSIDYSLTY